MLSPIVVFVEPNEILVYLPNYKFFKHIKLICSFFLLYTLYLHIDFVDWTDIFDNKFALIVDKV